MCSQGGTGWLMSVDQLTGGEPDFPVIDLNRNGAFDDLVGSSIPVGVATGGIPTESRFLPTGGDAVRVTTDSSGKITARLIQPQVTPPPGRMSWTGAD
jgi:Tfp pilus tip-associated adhesin PilY1